MAPGQRRHLKRAARATRDEDLASQLAVVLGGGGHGAGGCTEMGDSPLQIIKQCP